MGRRRRLFASLLAAMAHTALAGCSGEPRGLEAGELRPGSAPFAPATYHFGPFTLELAGTRWSDARLRVLHAKRPDSPLWESLPGESFVVAGRGRERVEESRGLLQIEDRILEHCPDQTIESISTQGRRLRLVGRLHCTTRQVPYALEFEYRDAAQLRFELEVHDPQFERVGLVYASDPEEAFFGFGEQFSFANLKGRRVPILVTEQGIGRGLQPLTWLVDGLAGSGGAWHTSYAPVPHYVTSRLRSVFLENTEYATFDLREPSRVRVEVFAPALVGRILHAETPLDLIEVYTRYAGRMPELPGWIHGGLVLGLQGGTARVREAVAKMEAQGAPLAGVWLQDWVGPRETSFGQQLWWNWVLDRERYPGWEELVADLRERGIRVLTYVNPFLVDVSDKPFATRNLFQEARDRGLLVRRADGEPYAIANTDFNAGLLDLTNPEARDWMLDVIRREVIGVGASGWMADFGEALPWNAMLKDGTLPARYHNRYAEDWAALNRRAIDAAGGGDELVFFTRAGFTRSPAHSTLFWLGDQLVSWDRHDGIKSAVTGLLSGGISGFALNHADVGGYTTLDVPLLGYRRSKELLLRGAELSAFQVVFRTHEGNQPEANHQFDSDPETLAHFARMAKLHAAWRFYREELIREASERGYPVVRHPFLVEPAKPVFWGIDYQQFFVGQELLVAPVLDPGQESVEVVLPAGRWVHLWSGERLGDPVNTTRVQVPAPLGQPAVLYREASAVGERLRENLVRLGLLP
jgi:alpha-glucosidase